MVNIQQAKDPARAIRYLLSDFSGAPRIRPEDYQEYNGVFKSSRMVQPFGIYKYLKFKHAYKCPHCGGWSWRTLGNILGEKRSFVKVYEENFDDSS